MGAPSWHDWLILVFPRLLAGEHIPVPRGLGHPRDAGFAFTRLAESGRHVADWEYRNLEAGSRYHVHEYADGRLVVHLDRLDPNRGLMVGAAHWFTESPKGRLALKLGAALATYRMLSSRRRPGRSARTRRRADAMGG